MTPLSRSLLSRFNGFASYSRVDTLQLLGLTPIRSESRDHRGVSNGEQVHMISGLLGQRDIDDWLSGKAGIELLRPAPNDLLRMWPVSKRANVSGRRYDDPSLIEPVEDDAIADG